MKLRERLMADGGYWARDLLLMTLLLGVLFGFKLGERALWSPDEGRYSEIPREMVASGDYITPRLNGVKYFEKPPLFYWLQSLSIKIFGLSEWSLRLWTALFAFIGCLTVYIAGRKLFDRRTGIISSVVLATSPLYYGMGQIITLDMAVSVLLAGALVAFLLATREPPGDKRRLVMWSFYCFSALATLTKGLIGFVIPALVIGTWMLLLKEWRLLKTMYLASGLTLFFLIVAPWHILVAQANSEFLNFYFIHEHFQRYLTKHHGIFYRPWFFVPVLLLGLFPWTCFLFQAIKRSWLFSLNSQQDRKETLYLILWAGWVFVFFSGSSSKLIPYVLPLFPPLAILLGRYFATEWDDQDAAGFRVGCWVVALISLFFAAGFVMVGPSFLAGAADAAKIAPFKYALCLISALGPLAALVLERSRHFRRAFYALACTSVLLLVVLSTSLPLFDQVRSVKKLAVVLKPRLKPEDEVASYRTYYQDLPVYLQRRITLVDWKGELSFGAQIEDVSDWMIDDEMFWRRWNGPATVYMVTPRKRYRELRARFGETINLVAQTDWDVLLSNKMEPGETPRK